MQESQNNVGLRANHEKTSHDCSSNGDELKSSDKKVDVMPTAKYSRQMQILLTCSLFLNWVCLGLFSEVLNPAIKTVMNNIDSNLEEIGKALSVREVGMFLGSLFGAFLADTFVKHRGSTMAAAQILAGLTVILINWCESLLAFSADLFFTGFAHGVLTSNGNPLLGDIWGKQAAGPFNFMHAGYGIGAALAPVFLAPFQFKKNVTVYVAGSNPMTTVKMETLIRLLPPCSIVAGLCLAAALFLLALQIRQRFLQFLRHLPDDLEEEENSVVIAVEEYSEESKCRNCLVSFFSCCLNASVATWAVIPAIFVLYFSLVGNERVFAKYLYVAVTDGKSNLVPADAFTLTSTYWIVFGAARILSFLVSLKVPVIGLFVFQLFGTWAMSLGFVFGPSIFNYWLTFTILFGLFKSPLFPMGLSVINLTVPVSGLIVFFVNLGSSVGASSLQYLAGYLMHTYGPDVFSMCVMVTGLCLILFGLSLVVATFFVRRRFDHSRTEANNSDIVVADEEVNYKDALNIAS